MDEFDPTLLRDLERFSEALQAVVRTCRKREPEIDTNTAAIGMGASARREAAYFGLVTMLAANNAFTVSVARTEQVASPFFGKPRRPDEAAADYVLRILTNNER